MPLRQPVPPLSFEACSQLVPDQDDDRIIGSDDDLDETGRTEQCQRVEKLAEAYLSGAPLFILSASLRGPLDRGWINPWKKDRGKSTDAQHNIAYLRKEREQPEQLVIPETNPRKRLQCHSPQEARRSRPRTVPLTPSVDDVSRGQSPLRRSADPDGKLPRSTHLKSTNRGWLRKDRVSPHFSNVDPPTSPTTFLSSRHLKLRNLERKPGIVQGQREGSITKPPIIEERQLSTCTNSSPRSHHEKIDIHAAGDCDGTSLDTQNLDMRLVNPNSSVYILSSSSQLPKFEYRRRKYGASKEKTDDSVPFDHQNRKLNGHKATAYAYPPLSRGTDPSQRSPSGSGTTNLEHEDEKVENQQDSLTLTNASGTIENMPTANLEKESAISARKNNTSEKLPSAQHVQGNPPSLDNVTSLHSIAISKVHSNQPEENIPDAQFSTQAALLLAQKSFQNDLKSPEHTPILPIEKRRASQNSNQCSPNSANITPFHQLNTPRRTNANSPPKAPITASGQPISTQYMIDAITPFGFSTEKKAGSRKDKSTLKKLKKTSFALSSSPSEIMSDMSNSGPENNRESMSQGSSKIHSLPAESQPSVLPMTLTCTTPPTAQDGQGAITGLESFNLSQAIAEAGSWLQQSFEINGDLKQCRNYKPPASQPSSAVGQN